MRKILSIFTLLTLCFGLAASPSSSESQIRVDYRAYTNFCSYYTEAIADLHFTLKDLSLPEGSKVFLHFGYEGKTRDGRDYRWDSVQELELQKIDAATWVGDLQILLNKRSEPTWRRGINFVFRVETANKQNLWINAGMPFGYYRVSDFASICVNENFDLPLYKEATIKIVR